MTTPKQPKYLDGLPPLVSEDAKKLRMRLEVSRKWLKDYQERRQQEQQTSEAEE